MEDLPAHPQAGDVEAIFAAALGLSPLERPAYLGDVCGSNLALRRRIEALLRAHEEAEDFLPEQPKHHPAVPQIPEQPGDKIGRYRLMEKIGEGGCGIVYVAEQEEPVRRKVALKVIKLGMDTREVVARFEAERQALAMMDHPNIARVFDAGVTGAPVAAGVPPGGKDADDSKRGRSPLAGPGGKMPPSTAGGTPAATLSAGRPYFVMELVRGVRITEFCDQHQLPTVERLKLFIQVCHAIQHAHQKGIIHRDIKPSNILVSLHDDVPVPKVIDFGIAKAIGERLTDKTLYTRYEQFIGTPAYMSPEQAGRSDLDIDTRTDIYALGVLLYELLTGSTPFDTQELLKVGLEEMLRTIREKEPVRPSTRIRQTASARLASRQSPLATPPSPLATDLDWIVMKCLEKNRTRRYEAANALARDVEAYLNHEVVTARPPSTAYPLGKFVRRNKVMVGAAGAVALALVLGIAVSSWQMVTANRARDAEKQLRLEARRLLYASDMKAAQVALEQNNRGMAVSLLRQHVPKPGEEDLRGLEWQYLWQESRPDEHLNFPHPHMVYAAVLSPDGRYLATACHDRKIRVWELRSATTIQEFETQGFTAVEPASQRKAVGFSPDGKYLALLGKRGVEVRETTGWSVAKELRSATAPVVFSTDGRLLVTGGTNGLQFWNQTDWGCRVLTNAFAVGNGFALSPDGSTFACQFTETDETGSLARARAEVWDVRTGAKREIEGTPFVCSLAISPDGKWLACGNWRGEVGFCTFPECVPVTKLRAQGRSIAGLAFSPDSKRLATGGSDQRIRIWETGTTNLLGTPQGHESEIWSLEFSKDGRQLVSGSMDSTAKIWDLEHGSVKSYSTAVATNSWLMGPLPDRSAFITYDWSTKSAQFWSLPDGKLLRTISMRELDPKGESDGDLLHVAEGKALVWTTRNGMVHILDPATGERLRSVQVAATNFMIWSVSRDLRWFVAWSADRIGLICDLSSPSEVHRVPDYYAAICIAGFSPDNRLLAYSTTNHNVILWDLAAKRAKATLKGHRWWPFTLAFSPDGKWLASGGQDGDVWLWSVDTGQPSSASPLKANMGLVMGVVFSSDSRTLATSGRGASMRWWSVATGRELLSFRSGYVSAAGVLDVPAPGISKGRLLLYAEGSNRVRVMTLPSLAEIDAAESQQAKAVQPR